MSEQLVFTAKVTDFEMDYMKFGHGPKPFVILPGMSVKSLMPLAPLCAGSYNIFTEDYTVYLFDRRKDFGPNYSIGEMAVDTALAMKSLGIAQADVMGISQGGVIAQAIAENYPELIRKLVLCSSMSRANATSDAVFEEWARLAKAGDIEVFISSFVDKVYTEKAATLYKQAIVDANRDATNCDRERFAVMAKSCIAYDGYEAKCPVLVLGASLDKVFTVDASVETYEMLKACGTPCEMHIFEGYGHAAYDEVPNYRKRILEFLRKP